MKNESIDAPSPLIRLDPNMIPPQKSPDRLASIGLDDITPTVDKAIGNAQVHETLNMMLNRIRMLKSNILEQQQVLGQLQNS